MFNFDPVAGTLLIPWWGAAACVLGVVVLLVLALVRGGIGQTFVTLAQFTFILLALGMSWGFLDRLTQRDLTDERRGVEARLTDLTGRAIAAGSPLACLDAQAGDAVQDACEKALFATAQDVAAANAYVSAQWTLLADAIDFSSRGSANYDSVLAVLRRSLEPDRFGFVAHILEARDQCQPEQCEALALLNDPTHVLSHLKDRTYDALVTRHSARWTTPDANPVAARFPPEMSPAAALPAQSGHVSSANFPSASSIPPVSIMNNEPGMPGQNGMDGEAKAEVKVEKPEKPTPARRPAQKPEKRAAQNPSHAGEVKPPVTDPAPRAP